MNESKLPSDTTDTSVLAPSYTKKAFARSAAPAPNKSAKRSTAPPSSPKRSTFFSAASPTSNLAKFFPSRGISDAFTKRTSKTTFAPQSSHDNSKRELFKPEMKVIPRKIDLNLADKDYNRNAVGMRSSERRVKYLLVGFLLLVVIGVAIALGLALGRKDNFCETGDEFERKKIADTFAASLVSPTELRYVLITIECVPEDAFGALDDQQKALLEGVQLISFSTNSMEKISERAFIAPELKNVVELQIIFNGLSDDLGDEFLTSLPNLAVLDLFSNSFKRMDSNVFRNSQVTTFLLGSNPFIEIPKALTDCAKATVINLENCASLVDFDAQMFSKVPLTNLDLLNSGLLFKFSAADLEQLLGLNQGTIFHPTI